MKNNGCLLILLLWVSFGASAQRTVTLGKDKIPRIAVDTLPTGRDFLLVTFSDNTFKYVPVDPDAFRDPEVYGNHWDTVNLFVYRDIELKSLPACTEIKLISDIGQFHCPANGRVISKYGPRGRRDHSGTDVKVEHGDPVYAAFDGIVRLSRWHGGGYGNLVIIRHTNGLETYYGHLSRRNAAAGDFVRAGQVIGYGGSTGRAYGTHLHFETRWYDQTFDPEHIIDFEGGHLRFQTFALEKGYFNIRSRAFEGLDSESDDIDMQNLLAAAEQTGRSVSDTIIAGIDKKEKEEAATTAAKYHTIRSGDNLGRIAGRYGTTVSAICKLNGISRDVTLRIGKTLRVQ